MTRTGLHLAALLVCMASGQACAGSLVELYTSQGCYSCPPADQFLGDFIAENSDHVALEFHVDYWDGLVHGSAGLWKDPFSMPEHSERQRQYNKRNLQGQQGVYTPQIVINGEFATVGSSGERVISYLDQSRSPLEIKVTPQGDQFVATVSGEKTGGGVIWIAEFERVRDTEVVAGENLGKTMRNHHMVKSLQAADSWDGQSQTITFAQPENGDRFGCAVIVQSEQQGAVLGAAYCP